ncbi:MAG: hypothetical protein IT445_04110 [Phycisphaeraceae bacterium]|nr:hypothetical protein [Phycisphaeraceae bacterium]
MHAPTDHTLDLSSSAAQQLLRRVADKRLIFTVTTGRSGTNLLEHLLALLPDVTCVHEAAPDFADAMRCAQNDPTAAAKFWLEHKLPAIAQQAAPIYIETSHLFCKGFLEPLLEMGLRPDLIVLKRAHRDIAQSLYRIQTIPGRTDMGWKYLLYPDDPGVLAMPGWQQMHDYQLCYWYTLEIDRRAAHYQQMMRQRGGRVTSVWLHELTTFAGFCRVLRELELPRPCLVGWLRYARRRRQVVNPKRCFARPEIETFDFDQMEQEVRERIVIGDDVTAVALAA